MDNKIAFQYKAFKKLFIMKIYNFDIFQACLNVGITHLSPDLWKLKKKILSLVPVQEVV